MSLRKLYAYYYPAHHRSRSGWFEWDLVRDARPWFDGHQKPDVPLWGELDDSLPSTFIRQARAAKAAGIDGFVIDTWWRPDGATLYAETLERAVLPAYASGDVPEGFDFGLLWCPVWPRVSLPVGMEASSVATGIDRLFPFKADDLLRLLDALRPYLTHERAIRIGGRPLLSFFHAWRLRAQLGAGLPDALDAMRAWGAREGPGALFLAGCVNQAAEADLLDSSGFDALTSYVWWPEWNGPARQDYPALAAARRLDHDALRSRCETPYWPSVAAGWDATPRGTRTWDCTRIGFPFTPVIEGNTPEAVASAIGDAIDWLDAGDAPPDHPVMIASWNEWSESHRIEPCERLGTGFLDAIARLRGR